MRTTILVPVYSETESLAETVERLKSSLNKLDYEILIVASPRSSQESLRMCEQLSKQENVRFVTQSHLPGQGQAFREAAAFATGDQFVFMCSDLESHPETVRDLIEHMNKFGSDVVVASRWHKDSVFQGYGSLRLALNWSFQNIFKRLYRTDISDLTFVFKIMKREVFQSFEWKGTGHEFALESTLRPIRAGYDVAQIPTIWRKRTSGTSKWAFSKNLRHLRMAGQILIEGERA